MGALAQTIIQELETHTAIEEEVLYPEGGDRRRRG